MNRSKTLPAATGLAPHAPMHPNLHKAKSENDKPAQIDAELANGVLPMEDIVVEAPERQSKHPWIRWLRKHLNFFRIHLLVFTFLPFFDAILLWAVNGSFKISFIDSLFLAYSAFTNTGLSPIDLSHTTRLQQVILFITMFFGSTIVVSWVVVLVRRNILASQCAHWVAQRRSLASRARSALAGVRRKTMHDPPTKSFATGDMQEKGTPPTVVPAPSTTPTSAGEDAPRRTPSRAATGMIVPFRKYSIRRVDTELKLVDPSGRISRGQTLQAVPQEGTDARTPNPQSFFHTIPPSPDREVGDQEPVAPTEVFDSPRSNAIDIDDSKLHLDKDGNMRADEGLPTTGNTPVSPALSSPAPPVFVTSPLSMQTFPSAISASEMGKSTPRQVGFELPAGNGTPRTVSVVGTDHEGLRQRRTAHMPQRQFTYTEIDVRPRGKTMSQNPSYQMPKVDERFVSKDSIGLGGFPGPIELTRRLFRALSARWDTTRFGRLFRPYPSVLVPIGSSAGAQFPRSETKEVPYFSFAAIVGKNSTFHGLTEEELDELGGVEYRGLRLLSKLVPAYYVGVQAIAWAINAPSFSKSKYTSLFAGQWAWIPPSWAGVFMGTSSMTNTGMSLVDTALIPFQNEFGVLIITSFTSLAGNTAFPILLRLIVWIGTKVTRKTGETWATLHFLLDHPRRCFLYLFPSHQTWFLLIVIFLLNMIDWAGFMLFDLGNPAFEAIPVNQRVINGFLQATSVRCAGVASVSLAAVAPATQVLYVIMMYIAPFPIALAIRSSNTYLDRSLGIYEQDSDSDDEEMEARFEKDKRPRHRVWGSYLAWHAKRQLEYDIWWLVMAWLVVTIFERGKIWNPATKQFDLFGILFELVSAYSSVGLSIGLSNANYSLSGAWSVPSKLMLILVMIRGRSRGLPVAIDRAVMLPKEFWSKTISQTPTMAPPASEKPRLETIDRKSVV